MTIVRYGFEMRVLRKTEKDFLDALADRISDSNLCEKCGFIALSMAIIIERSRWLGHVF